MAALNVKILYKDESPFYTIYLPVGSTDTISPGDLVYYDDTDLELFDTVTQDTGFAGVANGKSLSGETDEIQVFMKAIVNSALTSGTYTFGQGLLLNASTPCLETHGTAGSDAADTVAWFWDHKTSTITSGNCLIDVMSLSGGPVTNGAANKLVEQPGIS